jgi:uncharacterized membrane protein
MQYLVVGFEGNRFTGEILPELRSLRERGIIRVVDLLFIQKDQQGNVTPRELSDLSADEAAPYGPVAGDLLGLFTDEDVTVIASDIPPNSSVAIVLFENMWATKLRDVIVKANGVLFQQGLISSDALEALGEELAMEHASAQVLGPQVQ